MTKKWVLGIAALLGFTVLIFTGDGFRICKLDVLPPTVWRESYALSFVQATDSYQDLLTAHVRGATGPGGTWQGTAFNVHNQQTLRGIGLGRRFDSSSQTIFGYTEGDRMRIFVDTGPWGFGGRQPDHELTGVASAPAIIHVQADEWLIGNTRPGGNGIEVRQYFTGPSVRGFNAPMSLSGLSRNNSVAGRPALAYHNGRLVLVWGRVADNRAFQFAVGDYQPGTSSVTITSQGDIPTPLSGWGEFRSSPALAHDGIGTFYLAVVYRSSLTGLSHDFVRVYASTDGQTWSLMPDLPGNSTFYTAQTHVGIIATPPAGVLLAVVSGIENPRTGWVSGRLYRFASGAWGEMPAYYNNSAFPQPPDYSSDFAFVRHQFLGTQLVPPDEIAFQSNRDGNPEIYVMNADGTGQRNLTNNPAIDSMSYVIGYEFEAYRVLSPDRQWSALGSMIAFMTDRGGQGSQIYVMNADGSCPKNLTRTAEIDNAWPQWSPYNDIMTFARVDGDAEIYRMRISSGSDKINLSNAVNSDALVHWTPFGGQIVFQSYRNSRDWEIFTLNPDLGGAGQTNLTNDPADDVDPRWSPDGSKIAFVRYGGNVGNMEIFVMNSNGAGQRNLSNNPGNDFDPQWSPDGRMISFVSDRDGNDEIYVVDLSNPSAVVQKNLSNNPAADIDHQWSRDGSKIAFVTNRDGNWEVYVMRNDGQDQTNLTNHPADDNHPQWRRSR